MSNRNNTVMSELEREFEVEMGGLLEQNGGRYSGERERYASDDHESDDQESFELELEGDVQDALREFEEQDTYKEFEWELDGETQLTPFAERMYELSQRQYESEAEAMEKVNSLLSEMEREYFFGGLLKKAAGAVGSAVGAAKKVYKKATSIPVLGGLIKKGINMAGSSIPAFSALKGVTSLLRGDMRGLLGNLMQTGLGAAIPGAGAFLPGVLSALGFTGGQGPAANREAWNNVDAVAREAYEYLAENINEEIDNPLEASRLASNAYQKGLSQVMRSGAVKGGMKGGGQNAIGGVRGGFPPDSRKHRHVIKLGPGDEVVIRMKRS
jgi:hypothetical protein